MERSEILPRLTDVVVDHLAVDPATVVDDARFIEDLGADSLDLLQLLTAIEDEFDVIIPDERFEGIRTVDDAVMLIEDLT